uniref:Ankyrin repeat protein n=1 Tax=Chaetoceros debilis TaxID=122233 RepID=A0A7S3QAV0_9STRA
MAGNEGGSSNNNLLALLSVKDFVDRAKSIQDFKDLESLRNDAIETENFYRELFARRRDNWEIPEIDDNFHYLIDIFSDRSGLDGDDCSTDVFKCLPKFEEDETPRVFPLKFRREKGELGIVSSLQEFHQSWNSLTEDCLRFLDWSNVFAAGGAVAGCLAPLPERIRNVKGFGPQRMARRKYFHDEYLPGSDIDLFLYGIDEEQAKEKLLEIYDAVQAASPFPVRAFRSTHAITLVSQYPFRHVQIILRIYNSASEVLCGFDVDSCAVGYDGSKVLVPPRTAMAIMTQSNTVDMSRRSPSYETRLAKYANRGFEILVPTLDRDRVDPYLFEKRIDQVKGLSRLLILEKLRTPEERLRYRIEKQMKSSGHCNWRLMNRLRQLQNDRWNLNRQEGTEGVQLQTQTAAEASDYSTIFLPWGPDWTAARIEKKMKKKDKLLNKLQFKENGEVTASTRPYKIHVCATGTMEEVIANPFPDDPPLPKDVPSDELESMVYGEVSWLVDNPGRQQIGSFHPVTDEDWTHGAFFTIAVESLTKAAVTNNPEAIEDILREKESESEESQKIFLASKDFLGRTSLHLAALVGAVEACDKILSHPLLDSDNLRARLPDGRTALHIAAMKGNVTIVKLILDKRKRIAERNSADSSNEVDYDTLFDVLDIDGADWEKKLNPLQYAVALGQVDIVRLLIEHNADVRKMAVHKDHTEEGYSCLSLLAFYASECGKTGFSNVKPIVDSLLEAGASFTQCGKQNITCWHYLAMISDELEWNPLPIFLESAKTCISDVRMIALDTPDCYQMTPLYIATLLGNCTSVQMLLSYGAAPSLPEAVWSRMLEHSRDGVSKVNFVNIMRRMPIFLAASMADVKTIEAYCKVNRDIINTSITIEDKSPESRGQRGNNHRFVGAVMADEATKTIRVLDVLEEMLEKELSPSKEDDGDDSYWFTSSQERYDVAKATVAKLEKRLTNIPADEHHSLDFLWLSLLLEREKVNAELLDPRRYHYSRPKVDDEKCEFSEEDRLAQLQDAIKFIKGIGGEREDPSATKNEDEVDNPDEKVEEIVPTNLPDPMVNFSQISFSNVDSYHRYRAFNSYSTEGNLVDASAIEETVQLFRCVNTGDISGLKNAVAATNVYLENVVGETTPLFLAVVRRDVEAFKIISKGALQQYQRHIQNEKAIIAKKKERDDEMNKRMKNHFNSKNTIQGLVNRVNNLDLATGDLPIMASGPDSIRFELENAEAKIADNDSDRKKVTSSLPPEALLLHRSLFVVDDDFRKVKKHLKDTFSCKLDQHGVKELNLISLRPIELAVLKRDVAMVKEIIAFSKEVGVNEFNEEKDIYNSESPDDNMALSESDCSSQSCDNYSECEGVHDTNKSITQAQLKFSLVGPSSANKNIANITVLEMAAIMDNVEIFCSIASYAKEFILPLKLIELMKPQDDRKAHQQERDYYAPPPSNYSPLHFIFRCGSKNLIEATISHKLDDCMIGWLFDEPYEVPRTSKNTEQTLHKPFYSAAEWLSGQIVDSVISKDLLAETICRVVTVDELRRTPLFYVPPAFVPVVAKEGADYLASKDSSSDFARCKSTFVNSVTLTGVSALLMATALGDEEKMQALIDQGATRSVFTCDVKKWGVLHLVVENFDQFPKVQTMMEILLKDASDSELDDMLLSPSSDHTPLMLAVSVGRDEEITSLLYDKTIVRGISTFAHCDKELNSVLHLAAKGKEIKYYVELIKGILSQSSTLPGKENARGYTASDISLENVLSIWEHGNRRGQYQQMDRNYDKPLAPPRSIGKECNDRLKEKTDRRSAFDLLKDAERGERLAVGFDDAKASANDAAESARGESENNPTHARTRRAYQDGDKASSYEDCNFHLVHGG